MIKHQDCDKCGRRDITGTMSCRRQQLCPRCAGRITGVDPNIIRERLQRMLGRQSGRNGC